LYLSLLNVPPKLGEMGLANANMRDGIDVMRKGSPHVHVRKTPSELVRSMYAREVFRRPKGRGDDNSAGANGQLVRQSA